MPRLRLDPVEEYWRITRDRISALEAAYEGYRIKQMPLKVLKSHDIVEQDGQLVSLNVEQLDFKQLSVK